jgi:predicted O-linked N-acetylglucosamine transferase (SPINDLY family)
VSPASETFTLALQHHQAGDLAGAERLYLQTLQADPSHADAHCNLGTILAKQNRAEEAVARYRQALHRRPDHAEAHYNLGNALRKLGRLAEAVTSYREALRVTPERMSVHYNLGLALADLGQPAAAVAAFREAVRLQPDSPETYLHLARLLQWQGQAEEALACCDRFVQLKPDDSRGHNNLGLALASLGRLDEAMAALRTAVRLQPDYAEAYNSLGLTAEMQGRRDQAVEYYEQALRLQPDLREALNNVSNCYREEGMLDEAITCLRKSLGVRPDQAHVHSNLLLTLNYHPGHDPVAVLAEHLQWAERHAEPLSARSLPLEVDANPRRPLRVGYVSADFRDHAVASVIEPVLAAHDRDHFRIFCYSSVARPDAVTAGLQALADVWRSIRGLMDDAAAHLIRADAIDILVDVGGHTAGNRLLLFAQKPAPVQVTHFGYPNTTGMSAIDYRFSDPHADPPGATDRFYRERVIRLPERAWCYQPPRAPEVGELPALKSGHVTFGSFNNLAKVTAEALAVWSRILTALPTARLLLIHGGSSLGQRRVLDALARNGVPPERVTMLERMSKDRYLALYHSVDIGLDSFPYNGGVTTCDALWMGVPVICLAGKTCASRQGVSLLSNLGLPELAADTPDGYVAVATALATDLERLPHLRAGLRDRMRNSPLTDAPRFVRHLEDAYRRIWEDYCTWRRTGK